MNNNINFFKSLNTVLKAMQQIEKSLQTPDVVNSKELTGGDNLLAKELKNVLMKQMLYPENFLTGKKLKFNEITTLQKSILAKELLNLPKEFKDLLTLMLYKESGPQNLQKLLNENKKVSLEQIKEFFNENSKQVINKLISLTANTPARMYNTSQIEEIASLIKQIAPGKKSSAKEVMEDIILLYHPGIQVNQKQELDLQFGAAGAEEESEDVSVVIFLSTENIGQFMITLIQENKNKLNIKIERKIDYEGTEQIEAQIEETIKEELSKNSIVAEIVFVESERLPTVNKSKNREFSAESIRDKDSERKVLYQNVTAISSVLMLSSFSVTRAVFIVDDNNALLKTRQKRL